MNGLWGIYNAAVLVGLAGAFAGLVLNIFVFPSLKMRRRRLGETEECPAISVLVPARNEAPRILNCLRSLMEQEYPDFEVLVLDDNSTDGTADVILGLGFVEEGGPFRLLRGRPLPEGWVGKCWACHQLAERARGEFLLFTDADTSHRPQTLRAAAAMAQATRSDLLSAWPRLVTLSWSERLVIPLIHLAGGAIYPHGLLMLLQASPSLARAAPRSLLRLLGAANGQFLFFRREAYDIIGGHGAVKNHLVEDVALGREVAIRMGEGMRLVNCDASRTSTCRMYESFTGVWEGFTKNVRAAFEGSLLSFLVAVLAPFCCFLLPFFVVWFPVPSKELIVAQLGLIYLIRLILTLRFHTSWLGLLFHPLGMMLALSIALNSWRRLAGPGVTWKGRRYGARVK